MFYIAKDNNGNIIAWNKYISLLRDEVLSMLEYSDNKSFKICQVQDECKINFDKISLNYQLNP